MNVNESTKMTCIGCPKGCQLTVTKIGTGLAQEDFKVEGNTCKIGLSYAFKEMTAPMRVLTSTIRVSGGERPLVAVKSVPEVPKNLQLACMEIVKRTVVTAPVHAGSVLIPDILGCGANIVAGEDVLVSTNC